MAESLHPTHTANTASHGSTGSNPKWIDPAALMRVANLELRAKLIVQGYYNGLHRSPYHGFSVEFSEYRQYSPGDDVRFLDWKLLARSDRYYVKRFEDETNLRCHLVLDLSRSMQFGSLSYTKAQYAKTLAATFAYFLSTQRDAAGLLTFHDRVDQYVPPRHWPGHLHRLSIVLERAEGGGDTDLAAPLEQVAATVAKRGMIVLISDLLAPLDGLRKQLGCLQARGHDVIVMRVLDPVERDFPLQQPAMFEDLETGRQLYVDPAAVREQYLERFSQHAGLIQEICLQYGIDYFDMNTDRPLELALFDFVHARQRGGAPVLRRASSAASKGLPA